MQAKRLFAFLLSLVLLLQLFPLAVSAEDGICGEHSSWSLSGDGTLTITGTGTVEAAPAFSYHALDIKKIMIDTGITGIDENAFQWMTSLKSVSLPDTLTAIGGSAFLGCSALEEVTLPASVTSFGEYIFYGCSGLTKLSLPETLTAIPAGLCCGCTGLTAIDIPDGVTEIGEAAFQNCGLTAIDLPEGLTTVGVSAFHGCSALTSLSLPNITAIPAGLCLNCSALTKVVLPAAMEGVLGRSAFDGCASLGALRVPDGITELGDSAFSLCASLSDLTLPDTIETVGSSTFYQCKWLEQQTRLVVLGSCLVCCMPDTKGAVTVPDGVKTITPYAFADCQELTSVSLPDTVTEIPEYCFDNCLKLETVRLPSQLTKIGDYAFHYCESLTEMLLPDSITQLGAYCFNRCAALKTVHLPENLEILGDCCFSRATALSEITIPKGVTRIGEFTFYLTSLSSVTMPDTITFLGEQCFGGCENLKTIHLPTDLETMEGYVFKDCTGLQSIVIPEGVSSIGEKTFYGCYGLTALCLPAGLKEIGPEALGAMEHLTVLVFTGDAPAIAADALNGTNGLICYYPAGNATWTEDCLGDFGGKPTWRSLALDTHKPEIVPGTPASCTQEGKTGSVVCGECGEILAAAEPIPPLGHSYEVQETEDGKRINTCTRCGDTYEEKTDDPCQGYLDVNPAMWYHAAVDDVLTRGLMGSTEPDALMFRPSAAVTRGMAAEILYRLAGKPAVTFQGHFRDVAQDRWYANAVEWCAQQGIALGKSADRFDPTGFVTRQELAAFLFRYAAYAGMDTTGRADVQNFEDYPSVSSWAIDAIAWAVDANIMQGKKTAASCLLAPREKTTRAELAALLMRFDHI